jgi:hypothetical protein
MTTTFEGGCHCARVRFRVATEELAALDCNCSICTMKGFVHLIVQRAAFTLLTPESELTTYAWGTGVAKHTFCRTCGVHPFYVPRSHPDGVDVNVRCLDGDALARFTVTPFDGREWEANVERIR